MKTAKLSILAIVAVLSAMVVVPSAAKWTVKTETVKSKPLVWCDDPNNCDRDIETGAGVTVAYAKSAWTKPDKSLMLPNSGLRAKIVMLCNGLTEELSVRFNQEVGLLGFDLRGFLFAYNYRFRFDNLATDIIEFTAFSNTPKTIVVREHDTQFMLESIREASKMQLEVLIPGEGQVRFLFDLTGSTAAIDKVRASC